MCEIVTKVIFKGLMTFLALFLVGLFTWKYFTIYVIDDPKNKTAAILNAVCHCFLVLMLSWSLMATYCTDPGYVKSFFLSIKLPATQNEDTMQEVSQI
jgi:hypothetical protein